jgi:hypothetical protein
VNDCTHAYHQSAAAARADRQQRQRDGKAIPGSLEWRTFCETEVRLALDAAAATYWPVSSPGVPKGLDVDKIPPAGRGRLFGGES